MARKRKREICPINTNGCEYDTGEAVEVCMFWKPVTGCIVEALIKDLRSLPNKLKRLEERLEEGKHLT